MVHCLFRNLKINDIGCPLELIKYYLGNQRPWPTGSHVRLGDAHNNVCCAAICSSGTAAGMAACLLSPLGPGTFVASLSVVVAVLRAEVWAKPWTAMPANATSSDPSTVYLTQI